MNTQIAEAKKGGITPALAQAAHEEGLEPERLRQAVAEGNVVVLANSRRPVSLAKAVGVGCRVKVNANLGTSPECVDLGQELQKLRLAKEAGADTVMDLSTGGDLDEIRREIIAASGLPVGTVPIYQAAVETVTKRKGDHGPGPGGVLPGDRAPGRGRG